MAKEDIVEHQFDKLTAEEQRKIAKKGGIASGEARKRKRAMKEAADLLLSQPCNLKDIKGNKFKDTAKQFGIDEEDLDNQMAMVISIFNVAMSSGKNSVSAATFLRDTVGDKPKETIEVSKAIDDTIKEIDDYLWKKKN